MLDKQMAPPLPVRLRQPPTQSLLPDSSTACRRAYDQQRYANLSPLQRSRKRASDRLYQQNKRAARLRNNSASTSNANAVDVTVVPTRPSPSHLSLSYLHRPYYPSSTGDHAAAASYCTPHVLTPPTNCSHCGARRFQHEPPSFCCSSGKIQLLEHNTPPSLQALFSGNTEDSKEFRSHIRSYNSIFAFTSFGVTIDRDLASSRDGVYTFRAQGQAYHDLPSLLPADNIPRFFQLYFFDTANEMQNRLNTISGANLNSSMIALIMSIISVNPYGQAFRRLEHLPLQNYELHIRKDTSLDQRVYNRPTVDEVAAIWLEGPNPHVPQERDIIVHAKSGQWHRIKYFYGCYDPLQYPLLFPHGEPGWHQNIFQTGRRHQQIGNAHTFGQHVHSVSDLLNLEEELANTTGSKRQTVSCRQYYCYKLQIREPISIILKAGRLFQQYIVDMYIKLESTRLDFLRHQQSTIRADLYQNIVDSFLTGETSGANIGKRVVLPPTFIGGPRYMRRTFLNAMALVQHFGKPDLFITMTCNPDWREIRSELLEFQTAQDRPDLVARVFRAKFQDLKDQLFKKEIFGEVAAHVHVIEFQKRGLPHAHLLIIFKPKYKIVNADQFDKYVCAELPDEEQFPDLFTKVVKHMMHGPCGDKNASNSCMRRGNCKYKYPRGFCSETMQGDDSYPIYRRRQDGVQVSVRSSILDNQWVVPYNPYLLARYDCHINVEICSGIKAVKYLYKYIYKGHDRVEFAVQQGEIIDEIRQFQAARFVSAIEGIWRIYEFELHNIHPAVYNLPLHLPDKQMVSFRPGQSLNYVLSSDGSSKTMLTEFFTTCATDPSARQHLYKEFPHHFVWDKKQLAWAPRQQGDAIGRVNSANPIEGERYYLRLLLNTVRGPTSYADLLCYAGVNYSTFKAAAEARGLLASDENIFNCLAEAATFQMPAALRRLFASILVYCEPTNVRKLWDTNFPALSEDFAKQTASTESSRLSSTLQSLSKYLDSMGRDINSYDLPGFPQNNIQRSSSQNNVVADELAIVTPVEDVLAPSKLNCNQASAFATIMERVTSSQPGVFFVDGPGGTGKTFLYRALLASIRSEGHVALATASSGVAASILPGGRTAHSRFGIPLNGDESSSCDLKKQSETADLIRMAKLIIWDEAPMAKRWQIEAVDRSLQDILSCPIPFGGKVIVFGGDFRQVLPVVPRGTRAQTVNASVVESYLWPIMEKLYLTDNMRAQSDPTFSSLLLRIGNGEEHGLPPDFIKIPETMLVACDTCTSAEDCLINTIFPALSDNAHSASYVTERAILATKNEYVDMLNSRLISLFPGTEYSYHSYDEAVDDTNNFYPEEFLNTLMPSGFPSHMLHLKVNSPVLLLRNIDPSNGLCNGTRLVCKSFERNVIHAEISCGQHAGKSVFLHRIPFIPIENEGYPFRFKRTQFPIRLAFAMTINRAQGQTIPHVGVYLPNDVFSHGQLYVALSRGTSMATTKVLMKNQTNYPYTRNIVYQEVLHR